MKKLNYRPEIDGLRAIAVLSVILFHAGIDQISGGFIGVDIFYVISGYLITKIIVHGLENGNFSFSYFYMRRIKRILPAAVFMVIFTVILGAAILTPDKYAELSKSAISSNLFVANFWFMNNSGYFDLSTQVSPLVHMWSLSVEEQFYLIFPLILFALYSRFRMLGATLIIFLMLLVSLSLSVVLSEKYPYFSFYMLVTRAWELGIGAGLAILPSPSSSSRLYSSVIAVAGLAAIVYGLLFFSEGPVYPGYLALFPTFGTALIIYASTSNENVVKPILTTSGLVFIGRISYSAYLWHWPIIVYYRIYVNERSFDAFEACMLVLTSILVGYLSWRYVEQRFRYQQYSAKTVYFSAFSAVLLSTSVPGVVLFFQGFPARISESSADITDSKLMWTWECTEKIRLYPEINETFCVVGAPWKQAYKKGIVWGDSHSQHWAQVLHQEASTIGMSLVIAPRKCPPYLDSDIVKSHYPEFPGFTERCTFRNKVAKSWVIDNDELEVIIMAAAWSGHVRMLYTDDELANKSNAPLHSNSADVGGKLSEFALRKLLSELRDKRVLLLGEIPRPNRTLNECAFVERAELIREKCEDSEYKYLDASVIRSWHESSDKVLKTLANEFENVNVIIPGNYLCDEESCQTYVNDELIYKDGNHLRRNLSNETARLLSRKMGLHQYFSSLR